MKSKWMATASCGLLAAWCSAIQCPAQPTLGLLEPGLLLFGSVIPWGGIASGLPLPNTAVTWQISAGTPAESVTVPATLACLRQGFGRQVAVNGQFFHLASVPFETRSAGSTNLGQTPNVLALSATPATYSRSAWMGTNPCTFLNPAQATITFSKADRGNTERVDLALSIPTPIVDSDGDGMPDWAELIAGTDPHDPNSVLKLSTDVRPSPQGGLIIEWSSVPGRTYSILSTTDLARPFTPLATNILATATLTACRDATATGPGPFFYRIQVNN